MSGTQQHDITDMLPRMRDGDQDATARVWQHYFRQLVRFARRKLDGLPRCAADEEDVALSAMFSFCHGMKNGRFEAVGDREDLWKLLVTIAARKACAQRRYDFADKRDARRTRRDGSRPGIQKGEKPECGLEQLAAVTTDMAEEVVDNCHQLLNCLDDKSRQIALWRLEGYSKTEIAQKLGCVRRTVERKLERIRAKWSRLGFHPESR